LEKHPDGSWVVLFTPVDRVFEVLERYGTMPLPPYIRRKTTTPEVRSADRVRYQTVYAKNEGAVAAPTAGLHFTAELLRCLEAMGVLVRTLTLHVGPGTFRPVTADDPRAHHMHRERYLMPAETHAAVLATRRRGDRVIACGTTSVRTLEAVARTGRLEGETDLFILPPFEPVWTDGLITNFHLPRSTLLMLVSAFAGRLRVLEAYGEAIKLGYRFYSYGDAMLIL
ncbi:S-adenosylmethionine:tRNA ribosyltransferase-isomerase, partial [Planctomycetota bacterium]